MTIDPTTTDLYQSAAPVADSPLKVLKPLQRLKFKNKVHDTVAAFLCGSYGLVHPPRTRDPNVFGLPMLIRDNDKCFAAAFVLRRGGMGPGPAL